MVAPAAALLAAGLLAVGCSSDGGGSDDDTRDRGSQTSTDPDTGSTQPPATDEEAAFALVEDLVLEATALVDDLYQDPSVIEDDESEDLERLRELYTDDSPTPTAVEEQLQRLVDSDQRMRPADSGIFRDLGVYRPAAVDENTIRFRVCATEDRETVDAAGNVVDRRAQVTQGTGEARRIDGIWRFYGIHLEDDRTLPIEPGTANPGFCDRLFADEEEGT